MKNKPKPPVKLPRKPYDPDLFPHQVNNGFWDRPPEERAARMDAACERGGVSNFFDLSPEERGAAYDQE